MKAFSSIEEEEQYIVDHYLDVPIKKLARDLGRSVTFVNRVRRDYNLVIPQEILNARRAASTFGKGHVPFNKGKRIEEFMSPETVAKFRYTQFKKGNEPHNTAYDFKISLRQDKNYGKMYYIRISKANWIPLHRYIWAMFNGPIEKGSLIQFKDGNALNVEIDNLYMTDRKRQLRVNYRGGNKLPYELQKTIDLIYQLKTKIDEKQDA